MVVKKTQSQFEHQIKSLVGDEYTFTEKYVNNNTPIKVRHNFCGHIYKVAPGNFIRGRRCTKCSRSKGRKSDASFKKEVFSLVGNDYTFIEPYKKSNTPIRVKHNSCSYVYKVTPNGFLSGNRCPKCNGNNAIRKTTEIFKNEVTLLVGDEYTVIGDYVSNATPILIRHNVCGREYLVRPNNFINGSRCVICFWDSMRLSQHEASQKLINAIGAQYSLVSDYKSMSSHILVKHLTCGNTFSATLDDIVQKHTGCPICVQSIGEGYISSFLEENNIEFDYQKRFPNLKDKLPLSFDFFLPNYNILIEFQGTQHFVPKTFGGISMERAIENLNLQKKHDNIKRTFAKANGYILLEPNYKLNTYPKLCMFLSEHLSKLSGESKARGLLPKLETKI